jgi:hypothetical protein
MDKMCIEKENCLSGKVKKGKEKKMARNVGLRKIEK